LHDSLTVELIGTPRTTYTTEDRNVYGFIRERSVYSWL